MFATKTLFVAVVRSMQKVYFLTSNRSQIDNFALGDGRKKTSFNMAAILANSKT